VPAGVGDLQREVLVDLLAGQNVQGDPLAGRVHPATRALVQRELGRQGVRAVLEQILDAVEGVGGLFAARQRDLMSRLGRKPSAM
jgi:hypothetical protein